MNYSGENKVLTSLIIAEPPRAPGGGGGVVTCMAYTGMRRWTGYVQEFESNNYTCTKGRWIDPSLKMTLLLIFTLIYVS